MRFASQRQGRILVIASSLGGNYDAAADNRPDIFIAHHSPRGFVPARISGMSLGEARPTLKIEYWAELDLPKAVRLRELSNDDIVG